MQACEKILAERFGGDSLMALATVDDTGAPWVRTINAIYLDGSFYTITWAKSNKMRHLARDARAGLCGEWFSGRASGESLGHILLPENAALAEKLRAAFASWYGNGHVNEADPDTVILRLRLTGGVVFAGGVRYEF